MDIRKDGIAAIFCKDENDDCLLLKSVAIAEYNRFTKSFTILSGEFVGCTNNDFNILKGNSDFIYKERGNLSFVDNKKEYSIYIIPNKFIDDNYDIDIRSSIYEVYCDIVQKLSGIVLIKNQNRITATFSYPHYLENYKNGNFSDEKIDYMLNIPTPDGELNNEDVQNIASNQLPYGIQMIISYGDDEQEMVQNDSHGGINVDENQNVDMKQVSINEIIGDINSKIVGQEKAIRTLVTNIYYNQVLIDSISKKGELDPSELDSRKVSILLDGSTGTGKTAILKDIASKFDLPIDIVNANSFSETGYVGPTITDILVRLLKQANGNLELAERGIIVLDEIDKIATPVEYEGRDMKKGVQEELLSFIGGGKYDISTSNGFIKSSISFDTSKITFILSGAFTRLRDNKIKEQEKQINGIGFNTASNGDKKQEYEITTQDYIDYGLMREFFGRIKVLTSTRSYTKEDLRKILLESKISPLRNLEKTVQMFGYNKLNYNEEFINKICEEAYKLDTGARGLQTIMSGIQNKLLMDLINQSYNTNEPVEINSSILSEYKKDNVRTYTRKK